MNKIFYLSFLPTELAFPERRRLKLIHCHGVYDNLHYGHIRHLKAAKAYGDILVVTVTCDAHVNKGPNRPIFSHDHRAEMLAALECVDYVAISMQPTAENAIRELKPDIFVKGADYAGGICNEEREALIEVDAKLILTATEKYSTTQIIEKLKSC